MTFDDSGSCLLLFAPEKIKMNQQYRTQHAEFLYEPIRCCACEKCLEAFVQ